MRTFAPDERVPTGSLKICRKCHMLNGPVPGTKNGPQQLCRCLPQQVRRDAPKWGPDHDTYAELCRCCGLVLLQSGSRWSVWFCARCKPLVLAVNRALGGPVVPIGRHSLMHGIGVPVHEAHRRAEVNRVVREMKGLFGRIEWLEEYSRAVVAANLRALGFEGQQEVYLGEYLSRARRSDLTAEDAFARLVVEIFTPSEAPA